jgi:CRP-like cAMP-binding protein
MTGSKFDTIKSYYGNEMIFKESQTGNVGFLIKTGKVVIYELIDTEKVVLSTLESGKIFGEMDILTESTRAQS